MFGHRDWELVEKILSGIRMSISQLDKEVDLQPNHFTEVKEHTIP